MHNLHGCQHRRCPKAGDRFSQISGINYNNTYAPVTRLASLCVIIVMANHLHLELHQVDIKGMYLNSILNNNEVLYMQHPPGYKAPNASA